MCQVVWVSVPDRVGECARSCEWVSVPDRVGECVRFFSGSPFRTAVTRTPLRLYKSPTEISCTT